MLLKLHQTFNYEMIYIKWENKSGKLTGSLPCKMMKDKKQGVEVPF